MTIASVDALLAGFKDTHLYYKALSGTLVVGRPFSPFYTAGIPGAAVAPTPGLAGAALTSYPGQIPFANPPGGQNTYLARLAAMSTAQGGLVMLYDRLWHNSGIAATTTTAQTVNSVAFPARDVNGATAGEGVLIGLEVSGATGAGVATPTISYTNSAGVSGRTGTMAVAFVASSPVGSFYPFALQAGDTGVQSIQSITLGVSMASGTVHLVAYRPIVTLPVTQVSGDYVDALKSGMPRLYDNTVPGILFIPTATTSTSIVATYTDAQG